MELVIATAILAVVSAVICLVLYSSVKFYLVCKLAESDLVKAAEALLGSEGEPTKEARALEEVKARMAIRDALVKYKKTLPLYVRTRP